MKQSIKRALEVFLICASLNNLNAITQWSGPVNLSQPINSAVYGKVAIDAKGRAVFVWSRFDGTNFVAQSIWTSLKKNASRTAVISEIGSDVTSFNLAHDNKGNTIAIWARTEPSGVIVESCIYKGFLGWGPVKKASGAPIQGCQVQQPCVAVDGLGNAFALWVVNDGVHTYIQSSTKLYYKGWEPCTYVTIMDSLGFNELVPKIAVDNQSTAFAIWVNETTSTIQTSTKPFNQNWSDPIDLSSNGEQVGQPQIVIDKLGNAIAMWIRNDGLNYIVQAAYRPDGGTWTLPMDLSEAGEDAIVPQFGVDSMGNVTAIWTRSNGSTTVIQSSTLHIADATAASTLSVLEWSKPLNLSNSMQDADEPQISVAANGSIMAVWKTSDGHNFIVQAAEKPFGEKWGAPITLSESGQDAVSPQLAFDNKGNAAVLWQQSNNGGYNIVQGSIGLGN